MAELEAPAPEAAERLAALGGADLVIVMPGVPAGDGLRQAVEVVRRAADGLAPGSRTVLVHPGGPATDIPGDGPALLPFPILSPDQLPTSGETIAQTYRTAFQIGGRLGARGCAFVGSDPGRLTAEALRRLIQPVAEQAFDLVLPCYVRGRFDGLLLSAVVAPMLRALYGRRLLFPVGADFAVSARLLEQELRRPAGGRDGMPVWLVSDAVCAGLEVGQAHLGLPFPVRKDPPEASTALAQALGPLFLDVERNAACWQKVRGSQPATTFGSGRAPFEPHSAVDVRRMVETFALGYRNLQSVWSAVLPPVALVELKRLTTLAPAAFRLPDELWARMVYDFALAHRLRIMSRDHLLKAMTPLYLAWVASYANEVGAAAAVAVEYRLERLGAAFETQKPYFVSRWRWPDRFNP
jgi:hypothetical protein